MRTSIAIFWPPEFGLSVSVLKLVHFLFKLAGRKDVQLHPAEISRIKNKKQVEKLFRQCGFNVIEYHFGLGDLFTQVVIIAEKTQNGQ